MTGSDDVKSRLQSIGDRQGARFYVLLFLVVFSVYFTASAHTVTDSRWTIYTALSILREGNADIDEYRSLIAPDIAYSVTTSRGHTYSIYPLGPSLAAVPFVAVMSAFTRGVLGLRFQDVLVDGTYRIEAFIAAILIGLAVLLFFNLTRLFLRLGAALGLTLIFAFGTSLYSSATRALWSHTPSVLALTAVLYLFVKAQRRPELVQFAGALLAVAYIFRPTNSLPAVVFTIYVLVEHRRYLIRYLLGAALVALPFFAYNVLVFRSLLPIYYQPKHTTITPVILESLVGNLVSPGRGLLIFSPVLLFAAYGVYLKIRKHDLSRLDLAILAVIGLHWVSLALFNQDCWWGGHSYGPRLFTDVVPLICYFLIPVFARATPFKGFRNLAVTGILVLLTAVSVAINAHGANNYDTFNWNVKPNNIDEHPERVWDWSDPQFLR